MENLKQKLTLFFVFGILSIFAGIFYAANLLNGSSPQDGLLGIYILFGVIPVVIILSIDRLLVNRFGNQKINKVQFFFLFFIILLWIVKTIVNLYY